MWFILLSILAIACAQTIDTLSVVPVSDSTFTNIGTQEGQTFVAVADGPIQVTVRFTKHNPGTTLAEDMVAELFEGTGFGGTVLQEVFLPAAFFDGITDTNPTEPGGNLIAANNRVIEFDGPMASLTTGQPYTFAFRNAAGVNDGAVDLRITYSNGANPYANGDRWFGPTVNGGNGEAAPGGDDLIFLIEPLMIFPQE
jgi:hypothetical protein